MQFHGRTRLQFSNGHLLVASQGDHVVQWDIVPRHKACHEASCHGLALAEHGISCHGPLVWWGWWSQKQLLEQSGQSEYQQWYQTIIQDSLHDHSKTKWFQGFPFMSPTDFAPDFLFQSSLQGNPGCNQGTLQPHRNNPCLWNQRWEASKLLLFFQNRRNVIFCGDDKKGQKSKKEELTRIRNSFAISPKLHLKARLRVFKMNQGIE